MMAGLVAMYITSQKAFLLDVLIIGIILLVQRGGEEIVQGCNEFLIASETGDHALDVVRNMD